MLQLKAQGKPSWGDPFTNRRLEATIYEAVSDVLFVGRYVNIADRVGSFIAMPTHHKFPRPRPRSFQ